MRAVLDTNVVIAATLIRGGNEHRILRAWQHRAFELVLSHRFWTSWGGPGTSAAPMKTGSRLPPKRGVRCSPITVASSAPESNETASCGERVVFDAAPPSPYNRSEELAPWQPIAWC